jgi:hypothetical protein
VCALVALGIQHAMHMRHIAISGLHCRVVVFQLTSFGTIKQKFLNIKSLFRFSLQHLSEIFLIIRRTERGITNYISLHVKYPFSLAHFNEIEFSRQIFENTQNFMEILPAGA